MKQFVVIFFLCATFWHTQGQQKIDSLFAEQLNSFVENNSSIETVKDFLLSRGMDYMTFDIMARTDKKDENGRPLYYDKKKIHWFTIKKRRYDGSFYAWPLEIFMPDDEPTNFIIYCRCTDYDFCDRLHIGTDKMVDSKKWEICIMEFTYVPFLLTSPQMKNYLTAIELRFKNW